MTFVQVIDQRITDFESFMKAGQSWEEATAGKRTSRQLIVARDRDDPDRYFTLVFFDSYDSAMENSALPETQATAAEMESLADGPPAFRNLEVLHELRG